MNLNFFFLFVVGYELAKQANAPRKEENKRNSNEMKSIAGERAIVEFGCFFLLWVNGAGTAQCSAKEREQQHKLNSMSE